MNKNIFLFLLIVNSWNIYPSQNSAKQAYSITTVYSSGEVANANDNEVQEAKKLFNEELSAGLSDEDLESVNLEIDRQSGEIWATYQYKDGSCGGNRLRVL